MPKIDVNKVAEILKKNEIDPKVLRQIVEEMNILTQAEVDDEKPPAVKKQFAIIISDPEGRLPETDFAGWIVQIPEDDSVATTLDRIFRASYEFNTSKKGRLLPVKTVGEAIENVPAKHFKETGVWVKNKTPVLMLKTNNEIPMEENEKSSHKNRE